MDELLKKLIKAETTTETGELAAAQIIRDHLSSSGIHSEVIQWGQNRANIIAHIKSRGQRPALLFASHLDVVPPGQQRWEDPPFSATQKNGRIYGRGSADMKGAIAAVVVAIERLVGSGAELHGDIIFAALAGEETDSCGVKRFVEEYAAQLPTVAGVVITEPTNFEVITAHRGLLWLEVVTKGKTAHGSMPHLGINAISSMTRFLAELGNYSLDVEPHKLLGDCSMSVNVIDGGKAVNVVPDRCSVKIDIRTLPSQLHQDMVSSFEGILADLKEEDATFEAAVSTIRDVAALETSSQSDFVRQFCSAVGVSDTQAAGFCTDGPFLAQLGAPVVIFGPGLSDVCHKPDEYIEITDVERAVHCYTDVLKSFLG